MVRLALAATVASLLSASPAFSQVSPTTKRAAKVQITTGPVLERTDPDFAIIRWTTNNPGGSPVHFGIVRYGTDPKALETLAKSPIRLRPSDSSTTFRVRMEGLKPRTTYYYEVDSMESNGTSDGVKSTVKQFTTPGEPPPTSGDRARADAGRSAGGRE
jgi:phosphodiesterase/alkaline phosphatase D-like protein